MTQRDPSEVGRIVGPVRLPGKYVAAGAIFHSGHVLLYGEGQHFLVRRLKMAFQPVAEMPTSWVQLDLSSPFGGNGVASLQDLKNRIHAHGFYEGERDDPRSNLWCGGHGFLEDGRLMITAGDFSPHHPGNMDDQANFVHVVEIAVDGSVRFEKAPDMLQPRWYPGQVTLPDGRILASFGVQNKMEIYDPSSKVWGPAADTTELDDHGLHDDFPWTPVLPDGRVLLAGGWGPETRVWNPETNALEPGPIQNYHHSRHGGSALLMKPASDGHVMVLGGGGHGTPGTNSVELLNPIENTAKELAPMRDGRYHQGVVLLPTGQIWVSGGGPGRFHEPYLLGYLASVLFQKTRHYSYTTELYNPATDVWTETPKLNKPRPYHHVSLLLPDASVLVVGEEPTMEVYYPPYFFLGPRPAVTAGDVVVESRDQSFEIEVEVPTEDSLNEIVLMRQGAFTHSYNFGQRAVELGWNGEPSGGTITVTGPSSNVQAPPGYYMLFTITETDLPSRWAHWVHVKRLNPAA